MLVAWTNSFSKARFTNEWFSGEIQAIDNFLFLYSVLNIFKIFLIRFLISLEKSKGGSQSHHHAPSWEREGPFRWVYDFPVLHSPYRSLFLYATSYVYLLTCLTSLNIYIDNHSYKGMNTTTENQSVIAGSTSNRKLFEATAWKHYKHSSLLYCPRAFTWPKDQAFSPLVFQGKREQSLPLYNPIFTSTGFQQSFKAKNPF